MRMPEAPPACPEGWVTGPPDVVGVGVQRSGTTWWFELIASHPGFQHAAESPKEVHFFDRFVDEPAPPGLADDYARHFPRPPGSLAGEWTPRYMFDFWAPALLSRCAPEASLLVSLRDPVQRYLSGMAAHLESARRRGRRSDPMAPGLHVARSLYAGQLERLLRYFPREQILVLQFERCLADPAAELARTFRFLGLEPVDHRPPRLMDRRNTAESGPKPQLSPEAARELTATLCADLPRLVELVPDLDIERWPGVGPGTP